MDWFYFACWDDRWIFLISKKGILITLIMGFFFEAYFEAKATARL
jgi:hypothetical protein